MEEEMTQEIDMTKPQPWEPLPLLRYNPPSVKSMLTVVEFVMEMINDGRECMEEIVYGAKEDWANYPMRRKAPPFRAGDIRRVRRICASI